MTSIRTEYGVRYTGTQYGRTRVLVDEPTDPTDHQAGKRGGHEDAPGRRRRLRRLDLVPIMLTTPRGQTVVADAEKPDPGADYWTLADIAAYWEVAYDSVRSYRSREGKLPPQDGTFGRSPVWRPATVIGWQRPRQGARTDLHKEADDA